MPTTQLDQCFTYLRSEAINAHFSGDGIRVRHVCQTALELINTPNANATRLPLANARWVFSLSVFWAIDDTTLHLVQRALGSTSVEEESRTDQILLTRMLDAVRNPFQPPNTADPVLRDPAWLSQRSKDPEDLALFTLAVELTWFHHPFGSSWRNLAEVWLNASPDRSPLRLALASLMQRLATQTLLTLGRPPNDFDPATLVFPDDSMAYGYELFLNCRWDVLGAFLRTRTPRVQVDSPDYFAFFHLIHSSRMLLEHGDDQMISLSRLRLAASRSAKHYFTLLQEVEFAKHERTLCGQDASRGGGYDRAACFRLSTLRGLIALRDWDLGSWRKAASMQADAELEVALLGHPEMAKSAIIKKVRTWSVPDLDKNARFRTAILALDSSSEDHRTEVVKELVQTRPVQWPGARRVFSVLSDAIPDRLLQDVATWSARLETTTLRLHEQRSTFLEFWEDILEAAPNAAGLVESLEPALLHICGKPLAWDKIRKVFTDGLSVASWEVTTRILDALVQNPAIGAPFDEHRWAIVFDICARREDVKHRYQQWLRDNVQETPENPNRIQRHYIKRLELGLPGQAIEDNDLRQWLIQMTVGFVTTMPSTTANPLSLRGQLNAEAYALINWHAEDEGLIRTVAEAIERPDGLFGEKVTLLALLGRMVIHGPGTFADVLMLYVVRWLKGAIGGINPNTTYGGPFSIFAIGGHDKEAAMQGLLYLVNQLMGRRANQMLDVLGDWIVRESLNHSADSADLTFALMVRYALLLDGTNTSLAMAVVGMTEAVVVSVPEVQMGNLVRAFGVLLAPIEEGLPSIAENAKSNAGSMLLKCWEHHLVKLAELREPDVRQAVAGVLFTWKSLAGNYHGLELSDKLLSTFQRLREDARGRVRRACLKGL